jgi:hypothetical protein
MSNLRLCMIMYSPCAVMCSKLLIPHILSEIILFCTSFGFSVSQDLPIYVFSANEFYYDLGQVNLSKPIPDYLIN